LKTGVETMKGVKLKNKKIKKPATWREGFARLEKAIDKLSADFVAQNERNFQYFASKEELREVKENMMTKEDGRIMENRIMTLLDTINKNFINMQTEQVANVGAHERFDERLNSHEYRLKRLESHFRFPLPVAA